MAKTSFISYFSWLRTTYGAFPYRNSGRRQLADLAASQPVGKRSIPHLAKATFFGPLRETFEDSVEVYRWLSGVAKLGYSITPNYDNWIDIATDCEDTYFACKCQSCYPRSSRRRDDGTDCWKEVVERITDMCYLSPCTSLLELDFCHASQKVAASAWFAKDQYYWEYGLSTFDTNESVIEFMEQVLEDLGEDEGIDEANRPLAFATLQKLQQRLEDYYVYASECAEEQEAQAREYDALHEQELASSAASEEAEALTPDLYESDAVTSAPTMVGEMEF